jgi:hypothetical protein
MPVSSKKLIRSSSVSCPVEQKITVNASVPRVDAVLATKEPPSKYKTKRTFQIWGFTTLSKRFLLPTKKELMMLQGY